MTARHRLVTLLAGVCLLSAVAQAAPSLPPPAIDASRLSEHVKALGSDAFEGRGPGTAGEQKTIDYIAAQFAAAGLKPAGDGGGWMQAVPLLRFETPGEVKVAFTLNGKTRPLAELDDVVVHTILPVDHVSVMHAPMVFVGYGVSAPERGWDDFKGVDLRGKIAVVLINDPDFEMDPADPLYGRFDGKAMTWYGRWMYKYAEAARRGALGMLIIHETAPAAYGWATVKNSNGIAPFDIVRDRPQDLHPLVEGWLQKPVAAELFAAAGLDLEAEKARARRLDFTPVTLKGATFSTEYAVSVGKVISHNVVGRVEGSGHPGEAVLFGAHWDHLGVGAADAKGDRIYNGAVDNASGVAGLIELARVLAGSTPDRSMWFIGFTAEEKGLLGSEYWAQHPLAPLATTVGLLNLDVVNTNGPARDISTRGKGEADLDHMVAEYAQAQERGYTHDPHPEEGSFYRADHFSLAKLGVPAITTTAGTDLIAGGKAAGEAAHRDYIVHRYHQPADEWFPGMDLRGAAQDLEIYRAMGLRLANDREWPDWNEGSEFKTPRRASAAQRRP